MTVTFIPGNPPSYQLNNSDLSGSSPVGTVIWIGAEVTDLDTGDTYRVDSSQNLVKVPQQTSLTPDLALNASNLTLVLSGSKASAPVLDTARVVGFYTSSSSIRVGLEWPSTTTGSSSGSAAIAGDYQKGVWLSPNEWNWFNIGRGVSRVVYFMSGSPADTVKIVQT